MKKQNKQAQHPVCLSTHVLVCRKASDSAIAASKLSSPLREKTSKSMRSTEAKQHTF